MVSYLSGQCVCYDFIYECIFYDHWSILAGEILSYRAEQEAGTVFYTDLSRAEVVAERFFHACGDLFFAFASNVAGLRENSFSDGHP